MPQPGEASQPQPSAEDSFLDLLVETLEGLDDSARGQFLRQFFRTAAQIDLSEAQSNEYWGQILERRGELSESLGRRVSLKTAMVDVLASTNFLRVPILMEYDEFRKLRINAATDALTGLYNRRLFDEYCEKELNRAKRYGQQPRDRHSRSAQAQGSERPSRPFAGRSGAAARRQHTCARRCAPPILRFASAAMSSPCSCRRPTPNKRSRSAGASALCMRPTFSR